ncbi:DedA family protein [uncultured Methanobrevibacter sp.]|uniref:DedA family protein n=1 Tax=uncultured Methanobrevibacter sp. TaxID=253161 RepID=UPI00262DE25B|nr:DedA family protein [uncultured Methanobrevibacter sp.]
MAFTEILSMFVVHIIETLGYFGVFIMMTLESACIPFPSEVIMPFAGFVVQEGKLSFLGIVIIGTLGNIVGSLIAYYVGLKGGRPFLEKYGKYILITKDKLDLVENIFNRYGVITVFVGRILPVIRTFISLPAGIARMDIKKFTIYTTLGCFPWTLVLAYLGVILGQNWSILTKYFHILDVFLVIAIISLILYWTYKFKKQ